MSKQPVRHYSQRRGGAPFVRSGPGTVRTPPDVRTGLRTRHRTDAVQTPYRRRTGAVQTPSGRRTDAVRTPYRTPRTGRLDPGAGLHPSSVLVFVLKGGICVAGGGALMGRARVTPPVSPSRFAELARGKVAKIPTSDLPSGDNFLTLKTGRRMGPWAPYVRRADPVQMPYGRRTGAVRAPYGHHTGLRTGLRMITVRTPHRTYGAPPSD